MICDRGLIKQIYFELNKHKIILQRSFSFIISYLAMKSWYLHVYDHASMIIHADHVKKVIHATKRYSSGISPLLI